MMILYLYPSLEQTQQIQHTAGGAFNCFAVIVKFSGFEGCSGVWKNE